MARCSDAYCRRVEVRRGAGRCDLAGAPRFRWECLTIRTIGPSPVPATSNGACGFPALRFPADFSAQLMRPTARPPLPGYAQRHHDLVTLQLHTGATRPSPYSTAGVAASCRLMNGIISRSCLSYS